MGAVDVAEIQSKLCYKLAKSTFTFSFIVVCLYKLLLITYALLLIVDIAVGVLVGSIVEELMLSLENEHQEIVHR